MIDPKDIELTALKLELAAITAERDKSDQLYRLLADKYQALHSAHAALVKRAFPTELPI